MSVFTHLFDLLFPPRDDERLVRATQAGTLATHVLPRNLSACQPRVTALLPFADPTVRALIHEAKYRGNAHAFTLLAEVLREYLVEWHAEEALGTAALIPVPLSRTRRKERGYNQVEEVARRALAGIDLVLAPEHLARVRDTVSQTALAHRERKENVRGAFGTTHPLSSDTTYLLLDDVVTTGATLQAAIDALAAAGAVRIIPLALAH